MHTNIHKKFLNPQTVLFLAGLKTNQTVVDLGAGSGFFALAAAGIVGGNGLVQVVDVKDSALDHLVAESKMRGFKNVKTYLANLDHAKLPGHIHIDQADMVILSNILHEVSDHKNLIAHAYALLKTGGKLVVIDWNDQPGNFGPSADRRIGQGQAKKLLDSSLKFIKEIETDQYHFGMVFEK